VLNPKIPNFGVGERLAAGLAATQHSLSVCQCEGHQFWELPERFVVYWNWELDTEGGGVGRGEGNTAVRYNEMW